MRKRGWTVAALIAGSLSFGTGAAHGQDAAPVGTKVVIKSDAKLRVGRQVVGNNSNFRVYTVEHVNGNWLWLAADSVSGWVKSTEVIPFDQAIEFYTQEIRANPSAARAYQGRGLVRVKRAETDAALADFNEAVRLDPNDAAVLVDRAAIWFHKNDLDRALADCNEAIRLDPSHAAAFKVRGALWAIKKEIDKALSDSNQAIRLDPKDPVAFNTRGVVFLRKTDYQKALADFNEAIRLAPNYAMAFDNRGSVWYLKGDLAKALADYDEAIRLDPNYAPGFKDRGALWAFKKEFDKAVADYSESIRLRPNDADAFSKRGSVCWNKNEFDKALADYNEAIRLDPKNVEALSKRGYYWAEKGVYGSALDDYNEAIRLDPKLEKAYHNRACLWATCPDAKYRDGKKAVESATRSCELSAWTNPLEILALAIAHAEAGDFHKAVEICNKAISLETSPAGQMELGRYMALFQANKPYRERGASSEASESRKGNQSPESSSDQNTQISVAVVPAESAYTGFFGRSDADFVLRSSVVDQLDGRASGRPPAATSSWPLPDGGSPFASPRVVRAMKTLGNPAAARDIESIRRDPKDALEFLIRAQDWESRNEYDKAIADYNEAIRLDLKPALAFMCRGNFWFSRGNHNEALADFNVAIRLDPSDAHLFVNRGNVWLATGDYDKALADYSEATRLDPKLLPADSMRTIVKDLKARREKSGR